LANVLTNKTKQHRKYATRYNCVQINLLKFTQYNLTVLTLNKTGLGFGFNVALHD